MNQGIHITHEAAKKIGGIGSVLSGLCTAETYLEHFERTLFYGPLFDDRPNPEYSASIAIERLGGKAKVLFSSMDNIGGSAYDIFFKELIQKYDIEIVYGEKTLFDEIHPDKCNNIEILLVGVKSINNDLLNMFKFKMWELFQFAAQDYEKDWDFEQYLRIAVPFKEICSGLFEPKTQSVFFSHEYMGVASCLALLVGADSQPQRQANSKVYFHAHEISTARAVTENMPGHDVTFYSFVEKDINDGLSMEERFGSYKYNSRNELVKLTKHFDGVFAVGDWVKKEYKYLSPNADDEKIHICYNGTPAPDYSFEDKAKARDKIKDYCETLYNFTPDVIMTHVTRLVVSKGLWRDITLLWALDKKFTQDKKKGFYILLSSLIGNGRTPEEVAQMETNYGWPVLHKQGYPDLLGYENDIYESCQYFNAKSTSIKVIFINQFGFTPERVGCRLPIGTTFADLRLASDAEFGMSVYEPFGIAQIETIPFGGVAVLTKACGSSFLLEKTFAGEKVKPFFVFDFANFTNTSLALESNEEKAALAMTSSERVKIEQDIIMQHVDAVYDVLPKTDKQRKEMFNVCKKHIEKLSWNEVIKAMPFFKH